MAGLCTKIRSASMFVCSCHKTQAVWGSCDICIIAVFKTSSGKHKRASRKKNILLLWIWLLWFSYFSMCKTVTEYTNGMRSELVLFLDLLLNATKSLDCRITFWTVKFIFQVARHLPRNYRNLWKRVVFNISHVLISYSSSSKLLLLLNSIPLHLFVFSCKPRENKAFFFLFYFTFFFQRHMLWCLVAVKTPAEVTLSQNFALQSRCWKNCYFKLQ